MLTLLLTLACSSTPIELGGKTGGGADSGTANTDDTGTGGDDTGTGGDDTGTGSTTLPDTNPFEGDYSGTISMFIPEWEWEVCEGEAALSVGEDGSLTGEGGCIDSQMGMEIPVTFDGAVSDGGDVSGVVTFLFGRPGQEETFEGELTGAAQGSDLLLDWFTQVDFGQTVDVEGAGALSR